MLNKFLVTPSYGEPKDSHEEFDNTLSLGVKNQDDAKMKIFYSELNHRVETDKFALGLLKNSMPKWIFRRLRKDMEESLKGFTNDVALDIVDILFDCWSGLGLHLTGIRHVDAMLWNFYWRILDCARKKHIKHLYNK